jgi:tRNA threonylcarbamoyladenosine biosynthesis protein TsaB
MDTATPATAVAVWAPDGTAVERRHDPAPGERPGHAARLLALVDEVIPGWEVIERIAVGIGPGGFTGLRIGVVTARALAASSGLELRPVSSLAALAEGIAGDLRLALIDARRGELFGALHDAAGEVVWPPFVAAPELVAERVREAGLGVGAAGDGSIRFRGVLEAAGIGVDPDESRSHVVRALHVCRLALAVPGEPPEAVLPEYLRTPDAQLP